MRHLPPGRAGRFAPELRRGTTTGGASAARSGMIGRLPQEDAQRLPGQAFDAGIDFPDAADMDSDGRTGQVTVQAPRDQTVVAIEACRDAGPGPGSRSATRSHVLAGVKRSLQRLQPDRPVRTRSTASGRRRRSPRRRAAAGLEQIDRASRLPLERPGWMLERQGEAPRRQLAAAAPR